jgi:acetyltransferase
VETLARARPLSGERLAIMTNGGGPGVMAADSLERLGGRLARLSPESLRALDACLPPNWSQANPVDIIGDAPVDRYVSTLDVLLKETQADAVLFLHAPSAIVGSSEIARGVLPAARTAQRNVLTCWLGGDALADARAQCAIAGLPTYDTPESAVRAYMQLVEYRRNQALLMQIPAAEPLPSRDHVAAVQTVIERALAQGREWLSEPEAKQVLAASGIPVVETRIAEGVDEAVAAATALGYPVALKILSPQISHKSDVGGVTLGLDCAEAVREAAQAVLARVSRARPDAELRGFSVQRMVRREHARELIVGIADDLTFGPVILFGHGGTAVEQIADRAIALPPLNAELARDLIARTRVSRLLGAYRNQPSVDLDALVRCLQQVARLVADVPRIAELDINPLLADQQGVLALDARIRVTRDPVASAQRFAILPYPAELEEWIDWQNTRVLLRPIRPEDATQHLAFFDALSEDDVRGRMFIPQRELPRSQLARLTQIDYDREMAFIATREREDGTPETLGVVRALSDPDHIEAEFAIVVRSDLKRRGLGRILLDKIIRYSRARGTRRLVGMTLAENQPMRQLARSEGFSVAYDREDGALRLRLELTPM